QAKRCGRNPANDVGAAGHPYGLARIVLSLPQSPGCPTRISTGSSGSPQFTFTSSCSRMGRSATRLGCGIISAGMVAFTTDPIFSWHPAQGECIQKFGFANGPINRGFGARTPGIGATTVRSFFDEWPQTDHRPQPPGLTFPLVR